MTDTQDKTIVLTHIFNIAVNVFLHLTFVSVTFEGRATADEGRATTFDESPNVSTAVCDEFPNVSTPICEQEGNDKAQGNKYNQAEM